MKGASPCGSDEILELGRHDPTAQSPGPDPTRTIRFPSPRGVCTSE